MARGRGIADSRNSTRFYLAILALSILAALGLTLTGDASVLTGEGGPEPQRKVADSGRSDEEVGAAGLADYYNAPRREYPDFTHDEPQPPEEDTAPEEPDGPIDERVERPSDPVDPPVEEDPAPTEEPVKDEGDHPPGGDAPPEDTVDPADGDPAGPDDRKGGTSPAGDSPDKGQDGGSQGGDDDPQDEKDDEGSEAGAPADEENAPPDKDPEDGKDEKGGSGGPNDNDGPSDDSKGGGVPQPFDNGEASGAQTNHRTELVGSIHDPTELSLTPRAVVETVLLAALLILLIGFPSEMFNATLLENYEEISGWFAWAWVKKLRAWMERRSAAVIAIAFAAVGAIIHSQLEAHFGFDRGSLALLLGLFLTFLLISGLYDVLRGFHLRSRHALSSRLRSQLVGMLVAAILVAASRLGDFHPGYMYGLFTALAYGGVLHERHHGRALALASIRIFLFALVAWIAWIPVKHVAEEPDASFFILTLDAMLAVFWVAGVATIVFGLAPFRFFYGETVKAWNFWAWAGLWGGGVIVFVYTLLHPERGLYGSSDEASLVSVLALFVGFGLFSVAFWGYFRLREVRGKSGAGAVPS